MCIQYVHMEFSSPESCGVRATCELWSLNWIVDRVHMLFPKSEDKPCVSLNEVDTLQTSVIVVMRLLWMFLTLQLNHIHYGENGIFTSGPTFHSVCKIHLLVYLTNLFDSEIT